MRLIDGPRLSRPTPSGLPPNAPSRNCVESVCPWWQSSDAATGISSDELALAGKGFNEQVEAKLKADGTLDYIWVDRMMAFDVDVEKIREFRAQGNLTGGAQ